MEKLFLLKKGNMNFFACRYDCGMYTIEKTINFFAELWQRSKHWKTWKDMPSKTDIKEYNSHCRGCQPGEIPGYISILFYK